jgi:ATP-dependent Clp protease adaptor protein ClpS
MAIQHQHGGLLEAEKTQVKPPPMYKVLLLNDDYTPMDFVVTVLQTVFAMSREKSIQVMLQVHREGVGQCGTYTREVAAAKVDQVVGIARRHHHPLQCTMEEARGLFRFETNRDFVDFALPCCLHCLRLVFASQLIW